MDKIFTHTDLDGVGCAVLAKYYDPDIEAEFCDYDNVNQKVSDFLDNNTPFGDLYITDISVSDDIAQRIDNTDFILLDHHPTALGLNKYKCCTVKVEDEKTGLKTCGTELFYHWLVEYGYIEKTKVLDRFVEIIRDYDTWRWAELGNAGVECKLINDLLYIYGRDNFMKWCLKSFSNNIFPYFTDTESTLLKLRQEEIDRYVEKKNKEMFTQALCGKVSGFVFASKFTSELGNKLCKMHSEIDFVTIINVEDCTVSYRTIKDDIDLGKDVAVLFGGGGHPKAAGSQFDKTIWINIFRDIFIEHNNCEERIYKCFEKIADEENGKLIYPLNQSGLIAEFFGNACVSEFLDKCYQKWLVNHKDKYIEANAKVKQEKGRWALDDGVLHWRNEE